MSMTVQQIRDEIVAQPALLALLPDSAAIAVAMSVTRTAVTDVYGGIGAIMGALGRERGAAVMDALEMMQPSNSIVRWGMKMIHAGQLNFGSSDTRLMIDQLMAGGVIDSAERAALMGIAEAPDPVDEMSVRRAIWNDDGTRAI